MSSKTKKWTEEDVRRELRLIDQRVMEKKGIELAGGELEIEFTSSRRVLGYYDQTRMRFGFSRAFFDSDVPEACVIDVIRHEYAHYYTHVVNGGYHCHDAYFRAACEVVEADSRTRYHKSFEDSERRREAYLNGKYKSTFVAGQTSSHPVFGKGVVRSIECKSDTAMLTVDFGEAGTRVIDERWLLANGRK